MKNKGALKDFVKYSNHMGIFFVIWCFICFAWFYVHPSNRILYQDFLQLNFFFFSGVNAISFISSAIQSYLWGYLAVGTWIFAAKLSGLYKK